MHALYLVGTCCAYFEVVVLLEFVACICSLYHVLKFLPVCPIYLNWQLLHFIHICHYDYICQGHGS
jgi:hypothetical protein